ncbi:hypothetical protein [Streptomyces sp. L2]|nr:hypothetical protein [Streptomyces sp. L2]
MITTLRASWTVLNGASADPAGEGATSANRAGTAPGPAGARSW